MGASSLTVTNIEVRAGSGGKGSVPFPDSDPDPQGGAGGSGGKGGAGAASTQIGGGGGGGSAYLEIKGTVIAKTVTIESGSHGGTNAYDGKGGTAEFTVETLTVTDAVTITSNGGDTKFSVTDTLEAKDITVTKNTGGLLFEVGTLDVIDGKITTLILDNTADTDVIFDMIKLGSGSELTIDNSAGVTGNGYSFTTMEVSGIGAQYDGYLDSSNNLIFEIGNVANQDIMLTLSSNNNAFDLDNLTLTLTGAFSLVKDEMIKLIAVAGGAVDFFLNGNPFPDGETFTEKWQGYTFELKNDNGELIATIVAVPDPGSGKDSSKKENFQFIVIPANNNNINRPSVNTDQSCTENPLVLSASANPIQGGAELSVEAWSGEGCAQTFQWQILVNGTWVNIHGATKQDFTHTGLPPGKYIVRCIVKNAIGGEMSSAPIPFTVS